MWKMLLESVDDIFIEYAVTLECGNFCDLHQCKCNDLMGGQGRWHGNRVLDLEK